MGNMDNVVSNVNMVTLITFVQDLSARLKVISFNLWTNKGRAYGRVELVDIKLFIVCNLDGINVSLDKEATDVQ